MRRKAWLFFFSLFASTFGLIACGHQSLDSSSDSLIEKPSSSVLPDQPSGSALSSATDSSSNQNNQEVTKVSFLSAATTRPDNSGGWPYSGAKPIESVVDNDSKTGFVRKWKGEEVPGVIDLQLDGTYIPTSVFLEWGINQNDNLSTATTYSVFGSYDGTFYSLLAEKKNAQALPYRQDLLDISYSEGISYLRLCVYFSSGNYLSLSEVTLYGYETKDLKERIYPTKAKASDEEEYHPASNLLNDSLSTWRCSSYEKGSESGDGYKDVVLELTLPEFTVLNSVNLLLTPYIWDPQYDDYLRTSSLTSFEIEASQNGLAYQKVYQYGKEAKAYLFEPYINQSYGITASLPNGNFGLVKYIKIIFKKFEHLNLQEVFFTGTSSQNGLLNKGAKIRLTDGDEHAGIVFDAAYDINALGYSDDFAAKAKFGIKAAYKKNIEKAGFEDLDKRIEAGNSTGVMDLPCTSKYRNGEGLLFSSFLSGIPLDDFEESICFVPYLKMGSRLLLGKEGECSYASLGDLEEFIYPDHGEWKPNPEDFTRTIDGKEYFDVYKASLVTPTKNDGSILFPKTVSGYYLSDGVIKVDEETFNRLLGCDLIGNGAIQWKDYKAETYRNNPDPFDGVLPVSKMDDPLYVRMCKPNEQHSFMDSFDDGSYNPNGRVNASNLFPPSKDYETLMTIGALYLNPEKKTMFSLDTKITVCFGKIKLAVCTDKHGWQLITDQVGPSHPGQMYYLPWTLDYSQYNGGKMNYRLSDEAIKEYDDHYEVTVSVDDFVQSERRKQYSEIKGAAMHFWGGTDSAYKFKKGEKVLGIASSYEIWVKEKKYSDLLTADIGADRYLPGVNHPDQAFTGYNFAVTDKKRVVFGHNVGPKNYDQVMDSKKVCEMLGI